MKYIKIIMVLFVCVMLLPVGLYAQTNTKINIRAVVHTQENIPVGGAVVRSEQDEMVAFADSLGSFSIEVSEDALLTVSADGFETSSIPANADLNEIIMTPSQRGENVEVAYRTVGSQELLGGVSYVNMAELLDKNYMTSPLENMEAFAGGYHGNLWGMNDGALILVDGVPRETGSVMPTEIAQITFLKSAAAVVLYGSRAAKGAILINTKRGAAGKQKISARANAGVHVPKRYPKYLGSAEYMSLNNEARQNDGLNALYSEEDIYNHAAGTNPYRFPDVNYYSPEYLQEVYTRYDATVELSGGNERAQYYTNMGFWTEGSLLDFGEAANAKNERFNIRGNVDMKINKFLTARVDAAAIFYNGKGVNANFWQGAANLRPYRFAPLIPIDMVEDTDGESLTLIENSEHLIDGQYLLGGTQLDQSNPIADIYAGGSNTFTSRQFQFNAGVDADLSSIKKGLSFSSSFGLDYATSYNLSFNNEYAVYSPSWNNYSGTDVIGSLTKFGQDASSRSQNVSNSYFRQTLSFSGQLNYFTRINRNHNISAVVVAGGFQQAVSGVYHRIANANMGFHLGYNFKEKYYADFNGALIHSARLPEDNRQAFSPIVSLGWRISNEEFLASSSVIDNLKLSVSAGIIHTDLDISDYFLYEQIYSQSDGAWYSWRDGLLVRSTDSRRGANPDMTFPKREEISLGLDASLFNNLITLNGNVFMSKMTGIIVQNNILFPSYFSTGWPNSSFIPYVNYDEDLRSGFDFNLNVNHQIGQVKWNLGLTGTYFTTKAAERAENFENEYQSRQETALDGIWGLQNEGFFADLEEINSSPEQAFGEVAPGDIKYKDQNGDGIINAQDEVYLGRGGWFGAPLTLGTHLTARWKNFTFFALGIARTGAKAMKSNPTINDVEIPYFWINGEDKYSEVVRGRWTEETANTATFPRLTTQNGNNNFRNSDFWLYSTNRFDLAKVQISYDFPENMFKRKFLQGLGVYASGANLLTISQNREILEMNIGGAPQTRFFNLGLKAQF